MSIGTICNREVVIAEGSASNQEIARLMRDYHVGDVVIVDKTPDGNKPVGIITDRDLVVGLIAKGVSPDDCSVKDIMSFDLYTAKEHDGIWDVLQRMRVKGIRRMPVVDERECLIGIVTVDDLLSLLSDELTDLAKLVRKEQDVETKRRK